MTLCPIAMMVHCTGCPLVKFCPAKTILGDFGKTEAEQQRTSLLIQILAAIVRTLSNTHTNQLELLRVEFSL
jgi:hypothetical protein